MLKRWLSLTILAGLLSSYSISIAADPEPQPTPDSADFAPPCVCPIYPMMIINEGTPEEMYYYYSEYHPSECGVDIEAAYLQGVYSWPDYYCDDNCFPASSPLNGSKKSNRRAPSEFKGHKLAQVPDNPLDLVPVEIAKNHLTLIGGPYYYKIEHGNGSKPEYYKAFRMLFHFRDKRSDHLIGFQIDKLPVGTTPIPIPEGNAKYLTERGGVSGNATFAYRAHLADMTPILLLKKE